MDVRKRTLDRLAHRRERHHLLLGFDGFVDDLCHVMDVRSDRLDRHSMRRVDTMADFAAKIGDAAGLSCALELRSLGIRPGGNAPNMARAVLRFGNDVSLIATLGQGEIHPVFRDVTDACRNVISIGEPGVTQALEFLDGKVMLNRTGTLSAVGWDLVGSHVPPGRLEEIVASASLVGLLDWTIFPHMGEIAEKLVEMMAPTGARSVLFLDLSDLRRRTRNDVIGMAGTIRACGRAARTILSLNESEALVIAEALSISACEPAPLAQSIRTSLELEAAVVHPLDGAAVATREGAAWVDGPHTDAPTVSTGAGDTFNAGFSNGWLMGMAPDECALLGACTAGYFVRKGESPRAAELIHFIETYVS